MDLTDGQVFLNIVLDEALEEKEGWALRAKEAQRTIDTMALDKVAKEVHISSLHKELAYVRSAREAAETMKTAIEQQLKESNKNIEQLKEELMEGRVMDLAL